MKGLLMITVAFVILLRANSQNMFRGVFQKGYKRSSDPKYYRLYSQYYGTYSKRSSDFYNDPENLGYYAYHGKGYRRSIDISPNYSPRSQYGRNFKRCNPISINNQDELNCGYEIYGKRSSEFYDRPENYGYYAYHGKGYKRSTDFYDNPTNYGYYAYHGKGYKRSTAARYYGMATKRSSEFYSDPQNYGYYAYHGKGYKRSVGPMNYKRSTGFYDNPTNYGYYAYHGKGYKRSSEVPRSDKVEVTPLKNYRTKRFMRRTIPKLTHMDFKNITNCQYKSDNGSFLSCFNSLVYRNPLVCQVELNISSIKQFDFKNFGVESLVSNSTEKKFHLYPFKLNEKTSNRIFYNYQIILNQQKVELVLYHSPDSTYSGINVKDKECFHKLTNLLEKSSEIKTIDFEISSENALTKILFIGDIFIE